MSSPSLRPFRFWMTGCVAVVSLAIGGLTWADERDHGPRPAQASRFDVAETLHRLEAQAAPHGLAVLLRWTPDGRLAAPALPPTLHEALPHGDAAVLVFESLAAGGTPVMLPGDGAAPELPLRLGVRALAGGRAEVLMPPEAIHLGRLPPEVARELTGLPSLVRAALA